MTIEEALEKIWDVFESHDRGTIYLTPEESGKVKDVLVDLANSSNDIQNVSSIDNYKCCKNRSLKTMETTYYDENGREQVVDLLYCENCGYNKLSASCC